MTKTTMTEAVENLRTLIIEYEDDVYIDDGATNWDIRNLIDTLRVDDDGTLYDLIVCEDAIIELDEDGYRKSIPIMEVKPRPLSDRVDAWDKENIEQLREILAGCDNPEEEGIDLADLPTAQEVPEQIAEYPVWSIDKHGRALVGAAADQIEDLSEILSYYDLYVIIHRDCRKVWDGDEWTADRAGAAYYAPGQFPGEIQSLEGGYDLFIGTQSNGVPDEYEPPEEYWDEYKKATPVDTDDYEEPNEWLVDEYRESLYIVVSTEKYFEDAE